MTIVSKITSPYPIFINGVKSCQRSQRMWVLEELSQKSTHWSYALSNALIKFLDSWWKRLCSGHVSFLGDRNGGVIYPQGPFFWKIDNKVDIVHFAPHWFYDDIFIMRIHWLYLNSVIQIPIRYQNVGLRTMIDVRFKNLPSVMNQPSFNLIFKRNILAKLLCFWGITLDLIGIVILDSIIAFGQKT